MDKENRAKLIREKYLPYPQFLQHVQKNTASTQWGTGIMYPYDMEPYHAERSGQKPGRMLKKPSSPGRNRYFYAYDKNGHVIHEIGYESLGGQGENKAWIHHDSFYEYGDNHIIQYSFDVFGDEGNFSGAGFAETEGNKVLRVLGMDFDPPKDYNETIFTYEGDKVISIVTKWLDRPYPLEETFEVMHEGDNVRIIMKAYGEEKQVYPPV